jgi:cytoskeletal protein CcmA (bactofilin family)
MLGKSDSSATPTAAQARRFTDAVDPNTTVIGPGTRFKGELTAEGPVDVAGALEGDAQVTGHCRIRPGAKVAGRLEAIADGAFFEGAVRMAEPGSPVTFTEKRSR